MYLNRIVNTKLMSNGKVFVELADGSVWERVANSEIISLDDGQTVDTSYEFRNALTNEVLYNSDIVYDAISKNIIGFAC